MSVHTSVQVGGVAVLGAAVTAATARQAGNVLALTGAGMIHLMTGTGTALIVLGSTLLRRGRGRRLDAGTPLEGTA